MRKRIEMNEYNFYKLLRGTNIAPDVIKISCDSVDMVTYYDTLGNMLMNVNLSDEELEELFTRVRTLIKKFHDMGFIHGDLHNDNIVCSEDLSDIRLIDFEKSTYTSCIDEDYFKWYNDMFDTDVQCIEDIQEHELQHFII